MKELTPDDALPEAVQKQDNLSISIHLYRTISYIRYDGQHNYTLTETGQDVGHRQPG